MIPRDFQAFATLHRKDMTTESYFPLGFAGESSGTVRGVVIRDDAASGTAGPTGNELGTRRSRERVGRSQEVAGAERLYPLI
jgi:hypothetical protein